MRPLGQVLHLNIGELIISHDPVVISTVLGSCISVCLFSKSQTAGGMIHYALPRALAASQKSDALRYGTFAIKALIEELEKATGEPASNFIAKIVGGASDHEGNGALPVGVENIEIARKMLAHYQISIAGESVGGRLGRKVFFHVPSGRLQVAKIQKNEAPPMDIPLQEKRKVLIIDDSKTICSLLTRIISEDSRMKVVGTAPNPIVAEKMIADLKPDVLTLDIHMPEMDGVTFLEKYLPKNPLPVVMISSISLEDGGQVLRALELGAVDYIQKPSFSDLNNQKEVIRDKVYDGSFAKVNVRKRTFTSGKQKSAKGVGAASKSGQIIAIGASTGGTEALKEVLVELPADLPPILIVQHIPPVFSTAFAKRLNEICALNVKEASDGDLVLPGQVLLAPGDFQMELQRSASGYKVHVFPGEKVNRHRPSVDVLFNSVADLVGKNAIGVILTGMGADGARGLLKMRGAGARTIAQDEKTSVVFGMPKEAIRMGAAETVQPLDKIAQQILEVLVRKKVA